MADRFSGTLALGGKVTEEQMDDIERLLDECIAMEYMAEDGSMFFNECVQDDFSSVIEYCQKNNIPVCLHWEPKYEFHGELEFWIDGKYRSYQSNADREIVVTLEHLEQDTSLTVAEFIAKLDVPEFPPFEVVWNPDYHDYIICRADHREEFRGTFKQAIAKVDDIKAEFMIDSPFTIEDENGKTVWDSEEAAFDAKHL